FDGRVWSAALPLLGAPPVPQGGRRFTYTVTLEPSDQPRLFALDLPAGAPGIGATNDAEATSTPTFYLGLTRDQQLLTKAPVTQPLRYTQTSALRDAYPATSITEMRLNARMPPGNPRTIEFANELRARVPNDAAYIRAVLAHFREEPFVY